VQNSIRRPWFRGTLLAAVVLAAVAGTAAPASAHTSFLSSSPEAGSVVTEQPGTISVTTTDDLLVLGDEVTGMAVQVSGPAGSDEPRYYGDGCVTVSGATAATEVRLGEPGEYTVTWKVIAADSHPLDGQFTFTWEPAPGQELAEGSTEAPTCGGADPAGSPVPVDALWIGGAVLAALLAGVVTLMMVVRRRPEPPAGPPAA
jgi:copper resistance protein C